MGMMGIALGLLVLAGQGAPADEVGACARDATSPAERAALADAVMADGPGPALEEIAVRVRECAIRSGYDEARAAPLVAAGIALLAGEEMAARLSAAGIQIALVDSWFAGQDEEFRTHLPDAQSGERIVWGLNGRGVPLEPLIANAELVGGYIGMLIIAERTRLGLPLE